MQRCDDYHIITNALYFELLIGQLPLLDVPAGNHGSCINRGKYSIQDDEYNYHDDSLQASFIKGIVHYLAHTV